MSGGVFLLLCVLAFFIGTRAQKSRRGNFSAKVIRQRERTKLFLKWLSLVLIIVFTAIYIPAVIEKTAIAIDTRFDLDTILSIGILIFAFYTILVISKSISKSRKNNIFNNLG